MQPLQILHLDAISFLSLQRLEILDSYQKLVITNDQGNSIAVAIPQSTPATQTASLNKIQNISSLLLNEATSRAFKGVNLGTIKRAFFNNQDLPFSIKPDGTEITFFISADVTSKAGPKDLIFQIDQKHFDFWPNSSPSIRRRWFYSFKQRYKFNAK